MDKRVVAGARRKDAPSALSEEAIYALWDALADFPVGESDRALVHLMQTLCDWLDADNVAWLGAVRIATGATARRDTQRGWRARAIRYLNPTPERLQLVARAMREQDTDPGMTTRAIVAGAGSFRVYRLRDGFVDFEAFRRTKHWRAFYRDVGIVDRMCAAFPVNVDAESYLLIDHHRPRRRFSKADAELVARILRGLKWFHRTLLLSYGLPVADAALSPVQRRALALLLTDRTEKEIAAKLGVTPGTMHQYAVELYRKFGVKGRAGLMAMWLGH